MKQDFDGAQKPPLRGALHGRSGLLTVLLLRPSHEGGLGHCSGLFLPSCPGGRRIGHVILATVAKEQMTVTGAKETQCENSWYLFT